MFLYAQSRLDNLDSSLVPINILNQIDKLVKNKLVERRFEGIYSYVSLTLNGQQKIPEITGLLEEMEYELQRLVTKTRAAKAKPLLLDMVTAIHESKKS